MNPPISSFIKVVGGTQTLSLIDFVQSEEGRKELAKYRSNPNSPIVSIRLLNSEELQESYG